MWRRGLGAFLASDAGRPLRWKDLPCPETDLAWPSEQGGYRMAGGMGGTRVPGVRGGGSGKPEEASPGHWGGRLGLTVGWISLPRDVRLTCK